MNLEAAAKAVLCAADACRDAINGQGHPGEPHDRDLRHSTGGYYEIYCAATDCAACGGAQYGTEDTLSQAYGDLREALGEKRLPWEGVAVGELASRQECLAQVPYLATTHGCVEFAGHAGPHR